MAALPRTGVEVVVEGMGTFRRQMAEVNRSIAEMARQTQDSARRASGASKDFDLLGNSIRRVRDFVAAILIERVFESLARAFANAVRSMLEASADFQGMQIQFEGLIAREMQQNNELDKFIENWGQVIGLRASEETQLRSLRDKYERLTTEIERLTAAGKTQTPWFGELQRQLGLVKDKIEGLVRTGGEMDSVLVRWATGAMSMADALVMAKGPAAELLEWIRMIAVTTPFTVQSLSRVVSFGLAMGQNTEQVKTMTLAIGNWTAGMNISDEGMERMIYNFAQMAAAGKVTGTELRDLARGALFPVNEVLDQMRKDLGMTSMSLGDFRKAASEGKFGAQAFFDAFITVANRDFPNAMERMSKTWRGAMNNVKDFIQTVLGVDVLGPAVARVASAMADALQKIMGPKMREGAKKFGEALGRMFDRIADVWKTRMAPALKKLMEALGLQAPSWDGFIALVQRATRTIADIIRVGAKIVDWLREHLPDAIQKAKDALQPFRDFWDRLKAWWDEHGETLKENLKKLFEGLGDAAGPVVGIIKTLVEDALQILADWWETHGEDVSQAIGDVADWLSDHLTPALEDLKDWVDQHGDKVAKFLIGFGLALKAISLMTSAAGIIRGIGAALLGAAAAAGPVGWLAGAIALLIGVIAALGPEAKAGAIIVRDVFLEMIKAIKIQFDEFGVWLPAKMAEWIEALRVGVLKGIQIVIEILVGWVVPQEALDAFWNAGLAVANALISGLTGGLAQGWEIPAPGGGGGGGGGTTPPRQGGTKKGKSKKGSVQGVIQQGASATTGMMKKSFGIASPSTVFAEIGRDITAGLAFGIRKGMAMPAAALSAVSERMAAAARPVSSQAPAVSRSVVTNNTFNLSLSTAEQRSDIAGDFRTLEAMAGVL